MVTETNNTASRQGQVADEQRNPLRAVFVHHNTTLDSGLDREHHHY